MFDDVVALGRLPAPPGRRRANPQLLAEKLAAERRQERQERGRLDHSRAEGVGDDDVAGADGVDQAGDAEEGVAAQLERIAEAVVEAPEDHVDALQALERLDEDAAIAHRQVGAFDEREAEISRQVSVLEVGLVVRPRGEEHDLGRLLVRRRERAQRVALRAEEGRQPLNLAAAERLRQAVQEDEAILEGIARARRRLRAIGEHDPLAIGRARQIDAVHVQVDVARDGNPVTRAKKGRVGQRQRRRQQAAAQKPLWAVQIEQDQVEEPGPLNQSLFEAAPFVGPAR